MSRATDEAIKLANEYREHMFLLAIKRGLDLQDAHEYAARCAMEQLCKRDEIAAKAQVKRKLRR